MSTFIYIFLYLLMGNITMGIRALYIINKYDKPVPFPFTKNSTVEESSKLMLTWILWPLFLAFFLFKILLWFLKALIKTLVFYIKKLFNYVHK